MQGSDPQLFECVVSLVAEIREIDRDRISGSSRLREDLGMDSLSSLELLSAISEETGVDLPIEDAMSLSTVDDACALVHRMRKAGRDELRAGA